MRRRRAPAGVWADPAGEVERVRLSVSPDGSEVAIGGGLVAAVGPGGLSLVDGAWHGTELVPGPEWVTSLADGTIFAMTSGGVYYLGTRAGRAVSWTRVTVNV